MLCSLSRSCLVHTVDRFDSEGGWFSNDQVIFLTVSCVFGNKSSAAAEMGNRLAIIGMGRKVGAAMPLSGRGAGSPSNTMWAGPRPTSIPSGMMIHTDVWPQQTWAKNCGEGGGTVPLLGELSPHLTQSHLG